MGRSSDFKFWEEKLPNHNQSCGGNEIEFQIQRQIEDQFTNYSPPLWTRIPKNFTRETSPLLPYNHNYSCPSPTSRLRDILDGRRELMEIIKDMPESSYELSLKDIVDDQQNREDVEEKEVVLVEEKKLKHKTETRIPQNTKNTGSKICRTESMESGVFLLKMFLPVSLSSKTKSKARKSPKICPGLSSQGSEKQASKDWWKFIFLAVKDNKNRNNISRSNSDISSNKSRLVESTSMPCEWSSIYKKCKSRGQKGCLF